MATKDRPGRIRAAPGDFIKRVAAARWRALTARDAIERRVARLQQLSLGAQRHVIRQVVAAKVKVVSGASAGVS